MSENSRLGRCSACRFWKSATEILSERAAPGASPDEIAAAEASVRAELSQEVLEPATAVNRGWCLLAQDGQGKAPHLSINLMTDEHARAITSHDFGCINQEPRPRRAMAEPPPDYINNGAIGRCAACRYWSSADNEARALFAMYQYANEFARMEDCQRESYQKLSPPPFDISTGGSRGWCKNASVQDNSMARNLAFDPVNGTIGALITSREYGCTQWEGTANPSASTSPDYRWMANRHKLHNWGVAAPLDELYWSHGDSGQILNPENINSPMNELNPRALANPQNLGLNPNPAFAAYKVNQSMVNIITSSNPDKNLDPEKGRKPLLDDAPPPQQKNAAMSEKQQRATQRLAANFGQNTKKKISASGPTAGGGVSLAKKKDGDKQDRRKRQEGSFKKGPTPGGGPTDRRRT